MSGHFRPIRVVDLELGEPPRDLEDLDGYETVRALVRRDGVPLGWVSRRVESGRCSGEKLRAAAKDELAEEILRADAEGARVPSDSPPTMTVAVCTRNRCEDLAICLDSLCALDYPGLEILVVDNAPATDRTERLIRDRYPAVRYVCEPRPGLDWARNRAIGEASGEILAYTDDDCVVDRGWARSIAGAFADPGVAAVTGLVVPFELETRSQVDFETIGGFGRGFRPRWCSVGSKRPGRWRDYGAGRYGTGANMAFRLDLFEAIGAFDPALDVGTVTNGGGDLEMFFRVLHAGRVLAYEPRAVVRHRHRRTPEELFRQIENNGVGFASFLVRSLLRCPEERVPFLKLALWWVGGWLLRRCGSALVRGDATKRTLAFAELRGALRGIGRYRQARRRAAAIARSIDSPAVDDSARRPCDVFRAERPAAGAAVRLVEFDAGPVAGVPDASGYDRVRVYVTRRGRPRGEVDLVHHGHPIDVRRLRAEAAHALPLETLRELRGAQPREDLRETTATSRERSHPSISLVIATKDRPDDLHRCLVSLEEAGVDRMAEVVVVDNAPDSGFTGPILERFPIVRRVEERRAGLSYARNAGIVASQGDIVVTIDDDVTVPPGWLETIVAPFEDPDVAVVTGNVLPVELETRAQLLFESYGGLGRGFRRRLADPNWMSRFRRQAVATWELGATANAAFRRSIFADPSIGLLDESLGAGTPAGCSEDTDLFYRVLVRGAKVFYEPDAFVWHRHRRSMPELRAQVRAYARGHVAYHLGTLFLHGDQRALWRLGVELPRWFARRIKRKLTGRSRYPWSLLVSEIGGTLEGSLAYWCSQRRAARLGRTSPLVSRPASTPLAPNPAPSSAGTASSRSRTPSGV